MDGFFGVEFVRHVLQGMVTEEDEEQFEHVKPGLPLVAQIASYNQKMFASEEKALESLVRHAFSVEQDQFLVCVLSQ